MAIRGNDYGDRKATRDIRPRKIQVTKTRIKALFPRAKLDDIIYFCICFLSIVVVPLAAIAEGYHYYEISMNIRPVSESIIDDLNCTDLIANLSQDEINESVCSMELFETKFSLFHRQINYFHFQPNFGVSFCENKENGFGFLQKTTTIVDYFGAKDIPEDIEELLGGGNIGQCNHAVMLTAAGFSASAAGFAALGLFWFTVLCGDYRTTKSVIVHVILAGATMVSSLITIIIYSLAIDPLRSSVDTAFCDRQSIFQDCKEVMGAGFYCQIATATLSGLQIFGYALKSGLNRHGKNQIEDRQSLQEETHDSHTHIRFYKNPHFWVKFGRYSEFFLATMSAITNYTTLDILLPDDDSTRINMFSYLWGNQFCNDSFFASDLFLLNENGVKEEKFGDCKPLFKYKMILGLAKIVGAAGMGLFMKRDASKSPLFYLLGLAADLGGIIIVSMTMAIFLLKIYPGRSQIEPPFCDKYSEYVLEVEPGDPENCKITLGPGFILLCLVLPLTIMNLAVEFIAGEIGSKYGAINAFHTVLERIRKREYRSAAFKPSSFYLSKEQELTGAEDPIASKENSDLDIAHPIHQDKRHDDNSISVRKNDSFKKRKFTSSITLFLCGSLKD